MYLHGQIPKPQYTTVNSVQFLKTRVTFNSLMTLSIKDFSSCNHSIVLHMQPGEAKRKCLVVFVSSTK